MQRVRVVVGEFRRRMFRESLMTMLGGYADFDVEAIRGRAHLLACLESPAPTVIILDGAAEPLVLDPMPANRNVAVIRIGEEGREAQVLLYQIAPGQIRRIAGLISGCVRALVPTAATVRGVPGGNPA